jgi:hypothetical protein
MALPCQLDTQIPGTNIALSIFNERSLQGASARLDGKGCRVSGGKTGKTLRGKPTEPFLVFRCRIWESFSQLDRRSSGVSRTKEEGEAEKCQSFLPFARLETW